MRRTVLAGLVASLTLSYAAAGEAPTGISRAGDAVALTLRGQGVQVYQCRAATDGELAWAFEAPKADLLLDGQIVGHHYAGPTWEHKDGSRITGKVEAKADAPDPASIPWLRLAVATEAGAGTFATIKTVLRIKTKGGVKQGHCPEAGAVFEAPYEADYLFLR